MTPCRLDRHRPRWCGLLRVTGWPLYNIYKTRLQGADVAEGQAYFKAKAQGRAGAGRDRPG